MPVVVIVVLGGRWIPLDAAGPAVLPILFVHLGGLGVELGSHDAQAFGAREVETASRDPEAIFSLATQELGTEHFGFSAGMGGICQMLECRPQAFGSSFNCGMG
jgi:hypothetical protein